MRDLTSRDNRNCGGDISRGWWTSRDLTTRHGTHQIKQRWTISLRRLMEYYMNFYLWVVIAENI